MLEECFEDVGVEDILDRTDILGMQDSQEDNTGCGGKRVEQGGIRKAGEDKEAVGEQVGRCIASWAATGLKRSTAEQELVPAWVEICRVAGFHQEALPTRVEG